MKFVIHLTTSIVLFLLFGSLSSQSVHAQSELSLTAARDQLVRSVVEHGVNDERVLDSVRSTPRHLFVPAAQRKNAWYDMALPIGGGQTISPPFVVAGMTQHLDPQPTDRVLEIGTGSGYQAAILSPFVAEVYSIEIVESLGKTAARTLKRLGYRNVTTKVGDGFQGWAAHAPFDKIIVTCSPERIPQPLIDQLRDGGRMVIPLGERFQQTLYLYKKVNGELQEEALEPTFFVPMTGQAEQRRIAKDDSGLPSVYNGGFEQAAFDVLPEGWYAVRYAKVEADTAAPEGEHHLTFMNDVPARWAQALQAIGVDGRKAQEIEVTLWARGRDVRPASQMKNGFHGAISFFNANRAPIGEKYIGPWEGTFEWEQKRTRIKVPARARLAVFALGLCGGTGELSFDGVEITVVKPLTESTSEP